MAAGSGQPWERHHDRSMCVAAPAGRGFGFAAALGSPGSGAVVWQGAAGGGLGTALVWPEVPNTRVSVH